MNLLRAPNPRLFDLIQPYKVERDEDMPWAYQFANPKGRPLHDDWFIGKSVRRMDCAYTLPLPYRIYEGPKKVARIPFKQGYPLAPGTRTEYGDPAAGEDPSQLFIYADYGLYGLCKYEAWIPHLNRWEPVFTKYTKPIFGRRLSWYAGVHQDLHPVDARCYFPEFACSFVKEPA